MPSTPPKSPKPHQIEPEKAPKSSSFKSSSKSFMRKPSQEQGSTRFKLNQAGVALQTIIITSALILLALFAISVVVYLFVTDGDEEDTQTSADQTEDTADIFDSATSGGDGRPSGIPAGMKLCHDGTAIPVTDTCTGCPDGMIDNSPNTDSNQICDRDPAGCHLGDGEVEIEDPDSNTTTMCVSHTDCAASQQLGINGCEAYVPPTPHSDFFGSVAEGTLYVAVGGQHTCHLRRMSFEVQCWGEGSAERLGNNSNNDSTAKVDVLDSAGSNRLQYVRYAPSSDPATPGLAAGADHTCAIVGAEGYVYCWGSNEYGQLGVGDLSEAAMSGAVRVIKGDANADIETSVYLQNAIHIAAGNGITCAVIDESPNTAGGTPYCWGYKANRNAGSNSPLPKAFPAPRFAAGESLNSVKAVYVGGDQVGIERNYLTCILLVTANAYCWGSGIGVTTILTQRVSIPGASIQDIAIGARHACALTRQSNVYCWGGDGGYDGFLGKGTAAGIGSGGREVPISAPVRVVGTDGAGALSGIDAIAAGKDVTCAINTTAGSQAIYCWGRSSVNQLGSNEVRGTTPPNSDNARHHPEDWGLVGPDRRIAAQQFSPEHSSGGERVDTDIYSPPR